ncbi:hypothetical protein [Streptomyces sp. NPDC050548]
MIHDVKALALLAIAYYGGRARQWWRSRHQRKAAGAIEYITRKIKDKE